MKDVKTTEFFYINSRVANILKDYYQNTSEAECFYEGNDSELLSGLKANPSIGLAVYNKSTITSLIRLDNRKGNIVIDYMNIFYKNTLTTSMNFSCLSCNDRKIKCSDPKVPKVLESELTFLSYIVNFKKKYPHFIEKFSPDIGMNKLKYKNSYTILEKNVCKLVYFPFAIELENEDIEFLPEFLITGEAIQMIDKQVGSDYLEEDPIYPFEEFVLNVDDYRTLCKLSPDHKRIRILFRYKDGNPFFLANYDTNIRGDFSLLGYDGTVEYSGQLQELATNFISVLNMILYYYSHYKIVCEVEEKSKQESKSSSKKSKKYTPRSNVSTVIIPRKIIKINKEKVKTTRKRRKPLYNTKNWKRAAHVRRYRDSDGNVIKEVLIKETTCSRKKEMLSENHQASTRKKYFKVSADALSKATKQ